MIIRDPEIQTFTINGETTRGIAVQLTNYRISTPRGDISMIDNCFTFVEVRKLAGLLSDYFVHLEFHYRPLPREEVITFDIPIPSDKELLPFQVEGVHDIVRRKATLLADEMGLGKTIQAVAAINVLQPKRLLVVCPNSLKLNWRRELDAWGVSLSDDIEVAATQFYQFSDWSIMSYETLTRWLEAMKSEQWDLIIVDEAHMAKNPSSKRSKAVYEISKRAERVVYLTGTPIVNYPYEIYPLVRALLNTAGVDVNATWPAARDIDSFLYRYTYRGDRKHGRNLGELQAKLRSLLMTRRLKKDVLPQLPKKRRQVIEFPSDGFEELLEEERKIFNAKDSDLSQSDLINAIMQASLEAKETDNEIDWAALVESMKYNKRYYFEEIARIRHKVAVAKVPLVLDHLDNVLDYVPGIDNRDDASVDKIVVFGHHLDVLQAIKDHYGDLAVLVTGETSIIDRYAAVDAFQDPSGRVRVFVGGMKVASLGFTLTAASHVVFAELDWVPGTLTQAEDRLHRIGQEAESILIQHLVLENSIDAYMAKTVIRKQRQIEQALNKAPKV